jgi:hypothetical protein
MSKAAWIAVGLFLVFILAWFAFLAYDGVTHAGAPPGFPGP